METPLVAGAADSRERKNMNKREHGPRAVVADDEPLMRAALIEQLELLWPDLRVVAQAEDGPQALRALSEHRPDFAFLDIRMPGLTGLQVAEIQGGTAQVVFVTAYDQHAVEAFERDAVDYVLKPLNATRLARTVTKLQQRWVAPGSNPSAAISTAAPAEIEKAQQPQPPMEWLQVSTGTTIRLVHIDDVMFFESDTKYTRVVGLDCDGLMRTPLKELLPQLPTAFLQVHRSAIVNRRHVRSVVRVDDNMELEIKGHTQRLRVSEAHRHLFRAM